MKRTAIRMACLVAMAAAHAAQAHHSFAMFDLQKSVTLQGRVREFQWTNPHCFIQLLVPGARGDVEWSLEMHSPAASLREGWTRKSLQAGDRISVVIHPLRSGARGGMVVLARDAAGKPLHKPPVAP